MGFKFGQQRLGDLAAQQNFEQLEGELDSLADSTAAIPKVTGGRVNGDGTIAAGSGFTVVRNFTGDYTVTLAADFGLISVVTTGIFATTNIWTEVYAISSNSFRCSVLNASGTATRDDAWHFIAYGS